MDCDMIREQLERIGDVSTVVNTQDSETRTRMERMMILRLIVDKVVYALGVTAPRDGGNYPTALALKQALELVAKRLSDCTETEAGCIEPLSPECVELVHTFVDLG